MRDAACIDDHLFLGALLPVQANTRTHARTHTHVAHTYTHTYKHTYAHKHSVTHTHTHTHTECTPTQQTHALGRALEKTKKQKKQKKKKIRMHVQEHPTCVTLLVTGPPPSCHHTLESPQNYAADALLLLRICLGTSYRLQ
jgi:hypothetical protein